MVAERAVDVLEHGMLLLAVDLASYKWGFADLWRLPIEHLECKWLSSLQAFEVYVDVTDLECWDCAV